MLRSNAEDSLHLFMFRAFAVGLAVLLCAYYAIYLESAAFTDWAANVYWTLAALVLFVCYYLYSFFAIYKNDAATVHLLLWLEALLLASLYFTMQNEGILLSLSAFWFARTPHSYALRTCILLGLLILIAYATLVLLRQGLQSFIVILVAIPTLMFVLSISFAAVNEQRLARDAIALNRDLKAAQLRLAQSAMESERLRIAREIHDLLGHHMTVLILNLEVATHKTSGEALVHVEQSLALAKLLLGDLRNAVSELREHSQANFRDEVTQLLKNVPGLAMHLEMDETLVIEDARITETLLRCIQEAVTNTLRHAGASTCNIRLYIRDIKCVLEIQDDGSCPATIKPGNGLAGMKERIEAQGGNLFWQNASGRFVLQASLPLPGVIA